MPTLSCEEVPSNEDLGHEPVDLGHERILSNEFEGPVPFNEDRGVQELGLNLPDQEKPPDQDMGVASHQAMGVATQNAEISPNTSEEDAASDLVVQCLATALSRLNQECSS